MKQQHKGSLRKHIQSVWRVILSVHLKVKHPCDQCEFQASTAIGLKAHIKAVHQKDQCDQCEYKSSTKGSLKRHIESVHDKIKYPCFQCKHQASSKVY